MVERIDHYPVPPGTPENTPIKAELRDELTNAQRILAQDIQASAYNKQVFRTEAERAL